MPNNALREGFREVLRDPALLLIEIGWRWTFGAVVVLIGLYSTFLLVGSVSVDSRRLEALSALPALQLVQAVSDNLAALGKGLVRISLLATIVVAALWIPLSAIGRYATLGRPALTPGAGLRTCFLVSLARALLTLGSIAVWMIAGILAGLASAATAPGPLPNPSVVLAIALSVGLLIVTVWSALNWYSSFMPLFPDREDNSLVSSQWAFLRIHRDQLLEVSVAIGMVKVVLFLAALLLSIAASSVVQNPRILFADLLAIALLYFLGADFLYMVRLAAYGKLRASVASVESSNLENR